MNTLRYGFVGGGFITEFHLRALESVRGVEVAGLVSRTAPHALAASARERDLGPAEVFDSVRELAHHVDVIALCNPNFARQAIEAQPEIGALLPCNVVVRTDAAGAVHVEFMDPDAIMKLTDHPAVARLGAEVRGRLVSVMDAL